MHDEALAAEESGAQLLVEVRGQLHTRLGGQEGCLLQDDLIAWPDLQRQDLPWETGAEGNEGVAAAGGVDVLEHALAGEGLGEHLPHAAAGGLHLHVGTHPDHGAFFGDHLFAVVELADHHGECAAFDLVLHQYHPFSGRDFVSLFGGYFLTL